MLSQPSVAEKIEISGYYELNSIVFFFPRHPAHWLLESYLGDCSLAIRELSG